MKHVELAFVVVMCAVIVFAAVVAFRDDKRDTYTIYYVDEEPDALRPTKRIERGFGYIWPDGSVRKEPPPENAENAR